MKALILVGGLGTRLRPLTVNTAKALVPVLNVPFLTHSLMQLQSIGVSEVILTQGHLSQSISDYYGNGNGFGIAIDYVDEPEPLGTGGAIKNAASFLKDSPFFVLNGDIFNTIDLAEMIHFHAQKQAMITISCVSVADPKPYGLIETDGNSRISRFREKPGPDEITSNLINAGLYFMEPDVLKLIPTGKAVSVERETFPALLESGKPVYAYKSNRYWIDMGSPLKYHQLNMDLALGVAGGKLNPHSYGNVTIHPSSQLIGEVIMGEGSVVDAGAIVFGPAVIGARCHIGIDNRIKQSILGDDVRTSAACNIFSSVVAHHGYLGQRVNINNSFLADSVFVKDDISIPNNSMLWPGTVIN